MKKLVVIAAVAIGTASIAGVSDADTVAGPCSKAPPTPKGHIVARVRSVAPVTQYRADVELDKGKDAHVEKGNDAFLLTCDGKKVYGSGFKISSTTASGAWGTILLPPGQINTGFVGIDTGKDSKTPATAGIPDGYVIDSVISEMAEGSSKTRISIGMNLKDGAGPGDKGFFIDSLGKKVAGSDFAVASVGKHGVQAVVGLTETFVRSNLTIAIKPTYKCSIQGTAAVMTPQVLAGTTAPAGYIGATVTSATPSDTQVTIEIDRGLDHGVLPESKAYVALGSTGLQAPGAVDIISVTHTTSRGVVHVPGTMANQVRKLFIETGSCRN